MSKLKKINRWPDRNAHIRNIKIGLMVSKGKSCSEVAQKFDLSRNRINQIYRCLMASLCFQLYEVTESESWDASNLHRENAREIIQAYLDFYQSIDFKEEKQQEIKIDLESTAIKCRDEINYLKSQRHRWEQLIDNQEKLCRELSIKCDRMHMMIVEYSVGLSNVYNEFEKYKKTFHAENPSINVE